MNNGDISLLDKLDSVAPAPLAKFDAFPKLPSTYKSRSESRGIFTILVALFAVFLILNDVGEYIWGWPDSEFSVDTQRGSFMNINIDLTVNMPCRYLSVDLRDAVGDRLMLSTTGRDGRLGRTARRSGFRRDGTLFDVGQATKLQEHSSALSARQAVAQSRDSRGFFSKLFQRNNIFRPTVNHQPDASACRIYGSVEVKKVTANLHITTLGHGYASHEHVDHTLMNLSHVINEFSFGPFFPDIAQPLDYSFETTSDPFVAYQYYLHVVPTTYVAPRSAPLYTNQYSVTHYTRVLEHGHGTPGIFFKFDMEPLYLTIHQRTTTLIQLLIRCIGVLGGVYVCTGYAIRITARAVEQVTADSSPPLAPIAESTGATTKASLRQKWAGGQLRARPQTGRMIRQGSGWVLEGSSPYGGTPVSASFTPSAPINSPFSPNLSNALYPSSPGLGVSSSSGTPTGGIGFTVPPPPPRSPAIGVSSPRSPAMGPRRTPEAVQRTPILGSNGLPGTPGAAYTTLPPSPLIGGAQGVGPARIGPKKDD